LASKRTVARKAGSVKTAARAAALSKGSKQPTREASAIATAAAFVKGTAAGGMAALQQLAGAADPNDPIVLLEADHRRFERLLADGAKTTPRAAKSRRELLATLAAELNVHEALEEKLLYPALRPHAAAQDIVLEGYQEHHVADLVLAELQRLATRDEQWAPKFKVLKESLEHHIQEEERQMFRVARGVLDRDALARLGARMRALKAELEAG
jgi:hypothetical protein